MNPLHVHLDARNIPAVIVLLAAAMIAVLLPGCEPRESQPPESKVQSAPRFDGTIIAVGDSLTAGLGVAEDQAWPAILAEMLRQNGHAWQVINAGISGETSRGALSRAKWIVAQKPEVVILETGANDGLRGIPVPVIRENISRTVQILQQEGVTVVLAGMQMVRNLGPEYTGDFASLYPAVANEHDCILIPFFLEEVAGEPSLNQADSIHPNAAGHRIISETVYPYVVQAIAAAQAGNS
jgi:acyl-CoA thioesterase-1